MHPTWPGRTVGAGPDQPGPDPSGSPGSGSAASESPGGPEAAGPVPAGASGDHATEPFAWLGSEHDVPPPPPATHPTEELALGPFGGWPPAAGRQRRRWPVATVAVAGASALLGGLAGVLVGVAISGTTTTGSSAPAGSAAVSPGLAPRSYAAIAARVLPSVVEITVTGNGSQDTGSGVVIRPDGYILTNNHVVAAAAGGGSSITVTLNDGTTVPASIVGTDQPSDLAVVKVSRTGLPAARLGDSATLRVGDPVLAMGSPLGLSGTVTSGIVSALNRPVDTTADQQNPNGSGLPTVFDAIQTDAPINPGNSGGPLVDMAGQVVGIDSAIASLSGGSPLGGQSGSIGVGFAIPINLARGTAQQLISTGHATHPVLGVSITDATQANGTTQVLVQQVASGGPAASGGVQTGDVIVAIDGTPVTTSDALIAAVRTHNPGDVVSLTVLRNGTKHTLSVRLGNSANTQG